MIYVGIDDTDIAGSLGTNQLARALVHQVADRFRCRLIVRHQLLEDPRVPCTSKNGSASILLESLDGAPLEWLIDELRIGMKAWFIEGSDPGLCVAAAVPEEITEFGLRCKRELVEQQDARDLAARQGLHLEGLGGTEGGVIGALAAVGLAVGGDDGRVVHIAQWPDDLSGPQQIAALEARGVEVRSLQSQERIATGTVDVGKHLRPNYRQGRVVLFVQAAEPPVAAQWQAVKLA